MEEYRGICNKSQSWCFLLRESITLKLKQNRVQMCCATNSQPSQLQYFLWWLMAEKSSRAAFTAKFAACLHCSYLLTADTSSSADIFINGRRAQNFSYYKSHNHHLKPRYAQMRSPDSTRPSAPSPSSPPTVPTSSGRATNPTHPPPRDPTAY